MSTIEQEVEELVEVAEDVFGLEMAGTLMTPEEFDEHEEWEEGYTYELINGVLVVSPAPLPAETGPSDLLAHWLLTYQENDPQGSALDDTFPEFTLRIGRQRRRADRVIWAGLGRLPEPVKDFPTIVVEFVSYGKRNRHRDYVEKREEYLANGAVEYWLFDRFQQKLTVFRGDEEIVIPHDGTYRTPLLPGFELSVAKILDRANRYKKKP